MPGRRNKLERCSILSATYEVSSAPLRAGFEEAGSMPFQIWRTLHLTPFYQPRLAKHELGICNEPAAGRQRV